MTDKETDRQSNRDRLKLRQGGERKREERGGEEETAAAAEEEEEEEDDDDEVKVEMINTNKSFQQKTLE